MGSRHAAGGAAGVKALKAQFSVMAGVVPGVAIAEFTRTWHYTSLDFEEDSKLPLAARCPRAMCSIVAACSTSRT